MATRPIPHWNPAALTDVLGTPPPPDPDEDLNGPPGNHGEVVCGACSMTGYLMSKNERGFLVAHPNRAFGCRVPLDPPGTVGGELVVPVEISNN